MWQLTKAKKRKKAMRHFVLVFIAGTLKDKNFIIYKKLSEL